MMGAGFTAILLPWSFRFTKLVRQNDIYAFGCMRTLISEFKKISNQSSL